MAIKQSSKLTFLSIIFTLSFQNLALANNRPNRSGEDFYHAQQLFKLYTDTLDQKPEREQPEYIEQEFASDRCGLTKGNPRTQSLLALNNLNNESPSECIRLVLESIQKDYPIDAVNLIVKKFRVLGNSFNIKTQIAYFLNYNYLYDDLVIRAFLEVFSQNYSYNSDLFIKKFVDSTDHLYKKEISEYLNLRKSISWFIRDGARKNLEVFAPYVDLLKKAASSGKGYSLEIADIEEDSGLNFAFYQAEEANEMLREIIRNIEASF